jgi:hypothetical protein
VTWIGWGEARPKERVATLETELLELWGVSANRFDDLICAFETGQAHPRLIATPSQVRDHIRDLEGQDFTFAETARDRIARIYPA